MGRRSDPAPFFVFGQMKGPGAVRRARGGGMGDERNTYQNIFAGILAEPTGWSG